MSAGKAELRRRAVRRSRARRAEVVHVPLTYSSTTGLTPGATQGSVGARVTITRRWPGPGAA